MELKKIDILEDKSDLVQEILEKKPTWIIKWGTIALFVIILIVFLLTYLIKYPDVITSKVTLINSNPPIQIISKSTGPIKFLVVNSQTLSKNSHIGYIENSTSYNQVKILKNSLEKGINSWISNSTNLTFLLELNNLGVLQGSANDFRNALKKYYFKTSHQPEIKQIESLRSQLTNYSAQDKIILDKINTCKSQLVLTEKDFDRDKALFSKSVISPRDFETKEKEMLSVRSILENALLEKSNNDIAISNIKFDILKLENLDSETSSDLTVAVENSLKKLLSEINTWEEKFVLKTPIDGKISFFQYWQSDQFGLEGTEVATVIPNDESEVIIGRVEAPTYNSGKIKIGQKVNIFLNDYPYEEFGVITGRIESISLISRNSNYLIEVSIDNRLITSYKKKIVFKQEMAGTAEIITENISLLERIFYQLRKALINSSSK